MKRDDDIEAPSPEERALAESFAEHTDGLLAGEKAPAVLEAEERELLDLAGMVHSAHHPRKLDASTQSSIVDGAIRQAMGVAEDDAPGGVPADELGQRRARFLPAIALAAAAAAVVLFFVTRPRPPRQHTAPVAEMQLPADETSRPSDALIGEIQPTDSALARQRLDTIYRNRMNGYRRLRFQKLVGTR
jgi:hypothetical protein